jgi:enoyl-[acyl-carrier protein] reductase II
MAWVATAELAAAVSNAGGLGLIGAANMSHDVLRTEIKRTKAMTSKPFGVNIMLMSPFVNDLMQVVIDEKIPVVTTGAGNPGEYISALKAIGTKVIPVVASVALAIRLERIGVDAIIAEGSESGGHVGEVTTLALVPQVVDAVKIPVVAAGGIADARGVVAAFALGAKGVQIGTRFVASAECVAHDNYKQAIIKAKDRSTVLTGLSSGHPVRVIENKLARDFLALERRGASVEEFGNLGTGKLRVATREGDVKNGSVMVGQISGLIQDIKTVDEIIQDIVRDIPHVLESVRLDLTNEQ